MINHARNLLINISPNDNVINTDTVGEYIPAAYQPVKILSPGLKLLRKTLFTAKPDARFLNFRVRELLGCIHQTELADYIYKLDPRITYIPLARNELLLGLQANATATQIFGAPHSLQLVGDFRAQHRSGRAAYQYLMTAGITLGGEADPAANTHCIISTINDSDPAQASFAVGTRADTRSGVLPKTDIKVLLNFADAELPYASITTEFEQYLSAENYAGTSPLISEQPHATMALTTDELATITGQWLISVRAIPDPVIATMIPVLELLGEPVFIELFGVVDVEPYLTFKNIWFDHYSPVYRLAALTLALIYRIKELQK